MILETSAIISIAGWAASAVVNRLIGKLQSYTVKKYKWHQGLPEKLETLAHFLDEIGSTVNLVGARGFRDPKMMCWLSQLKDAIDEADDIFDVLDYEIIGSSSSQPDDPAAAEPGGTASIGSAELCGRLKKLLAKLNDIRQSSRGLVQASLLAVAGAGPDGRSRPVTGPLLAQEPLGYEEQYKKLQTWLLPDLEKLEDSSYNDRTVVAIIGHGGMGKTTLAQRAWNDPGVKKRFDVAIWAWVYNKFSEAELLGEIWRSAAAEAVVPAGARHGEDMSFSSMQQALEQAVASRRYLLVVDDVCNDEAATELQRMHAWSNVLAPFRRGGRGSRVLVTTRAMICAQTLGADGGRSLTLDGIGHGPFVRLLMRAGSEEEAATRARELQQFLRSSSLFPEPKASSASASWLAPNWRWSPLSAKEMELQLRDSRGKTKWAEIMAMDSHRNVVSVHESSFRHLPPHLQHCCAFISLFPNKFRFQSEMLVKMWIADGFISDDDGGGSSCTSMEDTARGYFNDLLARSFLQPVQDSDKTSGLYMVHDQIHSMIRSVSASYFRMMQPNCAAAKIPHTVRHLSVTTGCVARLKKLSVLKRLRTFIVLRDPSAVVTAIDKDLLKELEGVRVLDFTGTDIEHVPSEIGKLIHLRCLALPQTVQTFPEEFSKLFHLQAIIQSKYGQTDLDVAFTLHARNKTSLKQLKRLNSLRGSLIITGLNLVASKKDAQKARLNSKKSVRVLKLEWEAKQSAAATFLELPWKAIPNSDTDLEVLEGLQPHTGLQMLHIEGYRGKSFPSWLSNNCLSQLTRLDIINCRNWEYLPCFGDLPLLNHLQITHLESVREINGCGPFKSLETLVLSDMTSLEKWWRATPTDSGFTALKKIEILNCPMLRVPPPFPPTLELLNIRNNPQWRDMVWKR